MGLQILSPSLRFTISSWLLKILPRASQIILPPSLRISTTACKTKLRDVISIFQSWCRRFASVGSCASWKAHRASHGVRKSISMFLTGRVVCLAISSRRQLEIREAIEAHFAIVCGLCCSFIYYNFINSFFDLYPCRSSTYNPPAHTFYYFWVSMILVDNDDDGARDAVCFLFFFFLCYYTLTLILSYYLI